MFCVLRAEHAEKVLSEGRRDFPDEFEVHARLCRDCIEDSQEYYFCPGDVCENEVAHEKAFFFEGALCEVCGDPSPPHDHEEEKDRQDTFENMWKKAE